MILRTLVRGRLRVHRLRVTGEEYPKIQTVTAELNHPGFDRGSWLWIGGRHDHSEEVPSVQLLAVGMTDSAW